MRPAIAVYAALAWLLLWGLDRLWPIWPMHVAMILAAVIIAALAFLAAIAAGTR